MCGIAGAFSARGPARRELVEAIVASQRSRGPDHQETRGFEGAGFSAVLGHDRLAIIDLSPGANMPMGDATGRFWLVFNGEIYNYLELRADLEARGRVFRTRSDTEVLLEAWAEWGPDALRRCNGMFAFALLDAAAGRCWLARDRFAVKPLMYAVTNQQLVFGSWGRDLAAHLGCAPDLAYAARGLHQWVYEDDDERTPYQGVRSLRGGHLLEAEAKDGTLEISVRRWYSLVDGIEATQPAADRLTDRDAVDQVRALLEDSIRLRLRADVPVGVSLSGGLDSSLVTALLARQHGRVIGFTFGHPDVQDSEGSLAGELGRHGQVEVEYIWPDSAALRACFWRALDAQDAPFPGGAILAQYLVYERARERGIKVLLGGQGGDEAFMGYRKYFAFRLRRLVRERRLLEVLHFGSGMGRLILAELPRVSVYWRSRRRYDAASDEPCVLRLADPAPPALGDDGGQPFWMRQVLDITRFSLPTLLRYEDRNSMGHGIESRLPFLDYRVLELGCALPVRMKLRDGYAKWVLRQAARDLIPESIRSARYKRGFHVFQEAWIREGLGEEIRAGLRDRWTAVSDYVRPGFDPERDFSDDALVARRNAFGEATTLAWLATRVSSSRPIAAALP